jgi:hypothetical protein
MYSRFRISRPSEILRQTGSRRERSLLDFTCDSINPTGLWDESNPHALQIDLPTLGPDRRPSQKSLSISIVPRSHFCRTQGKKAFAPLTFADSLPILPTGLLANPLPEAQFAKYDLKSLKTLRIALKEIKTRFQRSHKL